MTESKSQLLTQSVVKSCLTILKKEKSLLIFPVIAGIISLVIAGLFYLLTTTFFEGFTFSTFSVNSFFSFIDSGHATYGVAFLVLYLFALYIVVMYMEVAMSKAVYQIINGQNPTLGSSLSASFGSAVSIIFWSIISAIVETIYRILHSKSQDVGGKLVLGTANLAWGLLTYFVVPIVAIEKLGIKEAVAKSANTFKQTWGEYVVSHIKFFFVFLPYVILAWIPFFISLKFDSLIFLIIGFVVAILGLGVVLLVSVTTHSILKTVLYVYASTGRIADGFTKESMENAFSSKELDNFSDLPPKSTY